MGDGGCGRDVITRQHRHADAGTARRPDRLCGAVANGIVERHEADGDEVSLEIDVQRGAGCEKPLGHGEHAQALAGPRLRRPPEGADLVDCIRGGKAEHHLRSALDA